jgi:hypothetical protein
MRIGIWLGNHRERDHLQDLNLDGGLMFKLIFKKYDLGLKVS